MNRQNSKFQLDFSVYCQKNGVTKISQDQVIVRHKKPSSRPQTITRSNYIEPSMMQFDNSLVEYFVNGQKNIARDLRMGNYKIIACIDLHNHTQASAMAKLENFIQNSSTKGNTCLKIIHGKGLSSSSREGVLKHMVRRYLENYSKLLAYSIAPNNQGGDGVTLVKLKNNFMEKKDNYA